MKLSISSKQILSNKIVPMVIFSCALQGCALTDQVNRDKPLANTYLNENSLEARAQNNGVKTDTDQLLRKNIESVKPLARGDVNLAKDNLIDAFS